VLLSKPYIQLIFLFATTLNEIANGCVSRNHLDLAQFLDPNDIIVTFNWDTLMERALREIGRWRVDDGYGVKPISVFRDGWAEPAVPAVPSVPTILKLHGSTNWLTAYPVYEGEDTDDGSIKLSPGKIQRTGVKSERAEPRVIRMAIRAPGTIQLDERRISVISMRAESWVQKVTDVTTGTRVTKGQPLMEIYSPAVASAAAEYVATITSKTTGGQGLYGRGSRQRLVNLDVPDAAIAAMEKTGSVPIAIDWLAPRDGIVLERNAIEGMRAQPGDVLFRVADISVVWAMIDVAERDLGSLALGQAVIVKARSFPGREFSGKIAVVYPQLNRETRTARVRVELTNADSILLPDLYVDAEIETGSPQPVLAVPESAVLDTGSRQAVFVERGQGRFEPRDVKLGHRGGGYVEVREGISEGELIVVSANFLIDAESNLKAALKGFSDAGAQP